MFRPIAYLSLLVLAAVSPAAAVDTLQVTSPDPITEAWRWTKSDKDNGVAASVQVLREDSKGNIWFGTDPGGLQRYDGFEWTTYTTEDGFGMNHVMSLLEAQNGHIWEVAEDVRPTPIRHACDG